MLQKLTVKDFPSLSFVELLTSLKNKLKEAESRLQEYYGVEYVYSHLFEWYTVKSDVIFVFTFVPSFSDVLEDEGRNPEVSH
jgi:hypothetical protein